MTNESGRSGESPDERGKSLDEGEPDDGAAEMEWNDGGTERAITRIDDHDGDGELDHDDHGHDGEADAGPGSAATAPPDDSGPQLADVLADEEADADGDGTAEGTGIAPTAVDPETDAPLSGVYGLEAPGERADRVLGGDTSQGALSVDFGAFSEPEEIRESVRDDVVEYFESREDDGVFGAPEEAALRSSFFDFSYLDRYEEVERSWVNKPFAYVSVLYDRPAREYRYRVTEPNLDEFERYVREDLVEYLRNSLLYQDLSSLEDRDAAFEEDVVPAVAERASSVPPASMEKLLYYLRRDFINFGPVDPIMRDPAVEDVSCDGSDVPVYVYHRAFRDLETNVSFSARQLSSYTVRLAQRAGKSISVSNPLLDATLPDGSRLQLTLGGEVSTRGSNFTIRKFSDVPFSPIDMIRWNTFSLEQMAYFWLAIANNRSLIFAGGTGSGKTSSMNAISFFIPPNAKVVSIEDTREIDLPHNNWIQSVTRGSASSEGRGEVTMYRLLQAALRQRPEYILVGEIRTEERVALTFFQAMGTGHTAYTTLHADSVETAINRLQNPPLQVPRAMIQDLDIVSIQTQTFMGDDRVRRNRQVAEILTPPENDPTAIPTRDVFRRDAVRDVHERVGESTVLAEIAEERGWTDEELAAELGNREAVLRFLLEEDVTDYRDVASVLQLYAKDPDYVMKHVRTHGYDAETGAPIGEVN